jgi:prevent-host-death family protein
MHRTQDTYPLSHFRQHTGDHLKRISKGAIETITQNGEAAIVVMSPARYDAMVHQLERGHLWRQAIARIGKDEGQDAREAIDDVAREFGIEL